MNSSFCGESPVSQPNGPIPVQDLVRCSQISGQSRFSDSNRFIRMESRPPRHAVLHSAAAQTAPNTVRSVPNPVQFDCEPVQTRKAYHNHNQVCLVGRGRFDHNRGTMNWKNSALGATKIELPAKPVQAWRQDGGQEGSRKGEEVLSTICTNHVERLSQYRWLWGTPCSHPSGVFHTLRPDNAEGCTRTNDHTHQCAVKCLFCE